MEQIKDVATLMAKWTDPELGQAGVQHSGLDYDGQTQLAQLLENTDTRDLNGNVLMESANNTLGTVGGLTDGGADATSYQFRPISLALVRRTVPELFATKVAGLQAMATPVSLAYAMRVYYEGTSDEANWEKVPEYSGFTGSTRGTSGTADAGTGAVTTSAEAWNAMGTSVSYPRLDIKFDKKNIETKSRKLAAQFSLESVADIRAMLNADLEKQIVDILNNTVIGELDREIIQAIKTAAITTANGGAQESTAVDYSCSVDVTAGISGDRTGDKLARILAAIDFQAEQIAVKTKIAAGNIVVASPKMIAALKNVGSMFTPLNQSVNGNKYQSGGVAAVGTLNGGITVYRDQFASDDYAVVAYKGANNQDAGVLFCPYQMSVQNTAIDPNTFGKIIGVMSRYAIVDSLYGSGRYYRSIKFNNTASLIPGV